MGGTTGRDGGQDTHGVQLKAAIRSRPPDRSVRAPPAGPGRQITVKAPEGHSRGKGQTRPAARPHQYECRGWSGGASVLVDESVTAGRSHDLEVSIWLVWWVGGDGWSLVE